MGIMLVYPFIETREVRNELSNFDFEIKWEVNQIGNHSALLYLSMELPEGFNNSDNKLLAEVTSIRSSFDHGYNNLYLGADEDLLFIQNGSKLENNLIVPSNELLTIVVEIDVATIVLREKTIEVVT